MTKEHISVYQKENNKTIHFIVVFSGGGGGLYLSYLWPFDIKAMV